MLCANPHPTLQCIRAAHYEYFPLILPLKVTDITNFLVRFWSDLQHIRAPTFENFLLKFGTSFATHEGCKSRTFRETGAGIIVAWRLYLILLLNILLILGSSDFVNHPCNFKLHFTPNSWHQNQCIDVESEKWKVEDHLEILIHQKHL